MKRARAGRYYGFINIGTNALIEESNHDMYSRADGENSIEVTSERGSKFFTTDKMIEKSEGYNEIVLWREYIGDDGELKDIFPDYIVCFNKVKEEDKKEARRLRRLRGFNIPIVLIDEKEYEKNRKESEKEVEDEKVKMPEEYEKSKVDMISVLRNASNSCSTESQYEALKNITTEINKKLFEGKTIEH